ncbi:protein FAM178B isoform X3 [Camelus bactrianus]|uniref:Protein FAM178B isoform X3 n=1 Tax=Camelus bactrianus TaxID=9837 RepID=A0AC58PLK2_CAMBA
MDGLLRQSDEDVRLWCPSMQEVTEVVHSLGTHDPALPPPGPFPHSGSMLKSAASPRWSEQQDTPREAALDISLSCICKFLTLCALAQPGTYTDRHLLGLMELLCRASLDVGLRLLPKTDLQQLLLLLLENIREWPGKLRHLCCTLSQASDHHHNLLALVQLFLDVTSRSRQLRSQLSLLIIARLLGRQEMLPLWQEKAQVSRASAPAGAWGNPRPAGSCCFSGRLGASGQGSQAVLTQPALEPHAAVIPGAVPGLRDLTARLGETTKGQCPARPQGREESHHQGESSE